MLLLFKLGANSKKIVNEFRILEQDEKLRCTGSIKMFYYTDEFIIRSHHYPFIGSDDYKRVTVGLRGDVKENDDSNQVVPSDRVSLNAYRIDNVLRAFNGWAKSMNKNLYYDKVADLYYID